MIRLSNTEGFSTKLLSIYLHGGLGAMSKKDTESLMVWLIVQHDGTFTQSDGRLDYTKLSIELKIPSKRVIELLAHARLRFETVDVSAKALLAHIATALLQTAYIQDGQSLKFSIHDALVREALENEVRKRYGIFENYFNKENISIDTTTLAVIMCDLCSQEQWEKIYTLVPKKEEALSKETFFTRLLKEVALDFTKSAAKESGKIVARGVAGILTGGVSEVLIYLKS